MDSMGSSCSLNRASRRKCQVIDTDQSMNNHLSTLRSLCRHSVDDEIPNESIASLYPVEDNYEVDDDGSTRSPKRLVKLCIEAICRNLTDFDGDLPPGIPQELVDDILSSLVSHSALNAATLGALRKCELGELPLFRCRGVSDEWLMSLSKVNLKTAIDPDETVSFVTTANLGIHDCTQHREPCLDDDNDNSSSKSSTSSSKTSYHSAMSTSSPKKLTPLNDSLQYSSCSEFLLRNGRNSLHDRSISPETLFVNNLPFMRGIGYSVTAQMTVLDLRGSQKLTDRGLLQLKDLHSLEIIRLDNCHSIVGRGFIAFSKSYNLYTASMSNCRRLTDEAITNISHLTSLNTLILGGCRCLTDTSLRGIKNLFNLRKLDLSQCDLITDDGLKYLHHINYLEDVNLGWCRSITDAGIKSLCHQPGRDRLQALCLARCQITTDGVEPLSKLKALRSLDLNGCIQISSSGLASTLGTLPNLETLDVSYSSGILRSSWQGKIDSLKSLDLCYSAVKDIHLSRLRHLPTLEELNLDSCPVGDWSLAHLSDGVVPNLVSLNLADSDITDLGMVHIAKFKKLKHLSLFYCNIGNMGIRHIGSMTCLESLNLDSRDITDDGLYHLRKLKTLKCLDIFSGRITDIGCVHLGKIKSLERLELCGGGIGDLGCTHLAENLPNLMSLNLAQNEHITNIGASSIASLVHLKSLNLSNTRVDSEALIFFRGLRQLQSLAMYGCRGVERNNQVISLQSELPNLKCLRLSGSPSDDGMVENDCEAINVDVDVASSSEDMDSISEDESEDDLPLPRGRNVQILEHDGNGGEIMYVD